MFRYHEIFRVFLRVSKISHKLLWIISKICIRSLICCWRSILMLSLKSDRYRVSGIQHLFVVGTTIHTSSWLYTPKVLFMSNYVAADLNSKKLQKEESVFHRETFIETFFNFLFLNNCLFTNLSIVCRNKVNQVSNVLRN